MDAHLNAFFMVEHKMAGRFSPSGDSINREDDDPSMDIGGGGGSDLFDAGEFAPASVLILAGLFIGGVWVVEQLLAKLRLPHGLIHLFTLPWLLATLFFGIAIS